LARLSTRSVANLAWSQIDHTFAMLQCIARGLSARADPCLESLRLGSEFWNGLPPDVRIVAAAAEYITLQLLLRYLFLLSPHSMRRDISFTFVNKNSARAEMGDRGHNRHGPKRGGCSAHFVGELGPHLTQCGLGRDLLPYQMASSSIQPFGHNRHEPKTGGCANFFGAGGAATPSNTTSPGPRLTSVPSTILIHPALWPQ